VLETAVVFGQEGQVLYWHEPLNRSGVYLPDSPDLWSVLWSHREVLGGVAHTHPWKGRAWPSQEDLTTFRAVEQGLGNRLVWPIVTFTDVLYLEWNPGTDQYWSNKGTRIRVPSEILEELRDRSGRVR
jgi:hypothetical protein